MAAASGIRVLCYWPDCQDRISLNNLAQHIETRHGVKTGFGCDYCGYTDAKEDLVRSHVLEEHGRRGTRRPAAKALAHYYRRRHQDSNPELRNTPKKDWWSRGSKSKQTAENCCNICGDVISPYTKAALIRHLRQKHPVVVDLDIARTRSRYAEILPEKPASSPPTLLTGAEDPDCFSIDELGDFSCDYDENDNTDDEGSERAEESRSSQPCLRPLSEEHTAEVLAVSPSFTITCDDGSEQLRRIFMSCIKEDSIEYIEETSKLYETRDISGSRYRVQKGLSPDILLGTNIVHAMQTTVGWRCEVPQCGANLDQVFMTDLHLHAHGTTHLTNWYCGESTCSIGCERVFGDREGLETHIAQEHMNSDYSFSAARRVPNQEVLASSLRHRLNFTSARIQPSTSQIECTNAPARSNPNDRFEITDNIPESVNGTWNDPDGAFEAIEQEDNAWTSFRRFTSAGSHSVDAGEMSGADADRIFREHCYGSYVFLSQVPKGTPPTVAPPYYLVETLTALRWQTETEAKDFINTYRQFCELLGTDNVDEVRKILVGSLPLAKSTSKALQPILQPTDQGAQSPLDVRNTQSSSELALQGAVQESNSKLHCPWPGCECTSFLSHRYWMTTHFLSAHLNCVWQCREKGCEYCCYLTPEYLERHRMHCHVGSPLQCGHQNCNQVLIRESYASQGHTTYATLRNHFEMIFNRELQNLRTQSLHPDPCLHYSSGKQESQTLLPSPTKYSTLFSGGSISYLSQNRREHRLGDNHRLLAAYGIKSSDVQVKGSQICEGFFYGDQHFCCADSINLSLETAMLIFVPKLLLFTVVPTCDYCIYVMSLISRPFASLPLPFHFGSRRGTLNNTYVRRIGKGSSINDHASFLHVVSQERLCISQMGMEYAKVKASFPQKIFIVDFETVRRSEKNLPLRPTEVAFRNGEGHIIISCVINEKGVTNAQFEAQLRKSGYSDPKSFQGVRRIRGPPENTLPPNAKTSKEIVRILVEAGLKPDCLWVEYSTSFFDWKCMRVLIEQAGESIESILPPTPSCWTVIQDFARCLPGTCETN